VGETEKKINYHQGIFIDIFPANFINPSEVRLYKTILFMTKLFANRYLHIDALANVGIGYLNHFHQGKEGKLVVAGGESIHWFRPYAREHLFPLKTMHFEKDNYPVPGDTDYVLQKIFGSNFLKLPPPEKRKVHSVLIRTDTPCDKERRWGK
jgi:phosphorylcholine metabolism protein LicD